MQKIDFVNSQQPAINDTNLNLMQQYIETAIQGAVSGDTLPVGAIMPFGGGTVPDNYLLCNGQAVSRTTYAQLFSVIGTSYGVGDGSTTFNVPDLRGKVPVGYDSTQTEFNSLGKTGGEKTHTLTINEIPSHNHQLKRTGATGTAGYNSIYNSANTSTENYSTTYAGGGQAHNNLQPYNTTNYIIKAFQTAGTVASIVNAHSTSTTNAYSCNYFEPVDISSLITKNSNKIGTIYAISAYKKGTRCYFECQCDLLAEGATLFTLDNSIKPKYTSFGNGVNYQSGSSQPMIIKTTANSTTIDCNIYASSLKSYATIHLEWEV